MTDLLGPGAFGAGNSTTTRPANTPGNGGADPFSWFKDCASALTKDGTEMRAAWLNAVLARFRNLLTRGGYASDNTDEYDLTRAIRGQALNVATAGGTANAITLTCNPTFTSLSQLVNVPLRFVATADNTGAVTIQVDALTAKNLLYLDGRALPQGEILTGRIVEIIYDGTQFRLMNQFGQAAVPKITKLTSGSAATFTTSVGCRLMRVRMVGGGGGGSGVKYSVGYFLGGAGGDTSFNSVTAKGAAVPQSYTVAGLAAGPGTGTAALRVKGSRGGPGSSVSGGVNTTGGYGGVSPFCGAGTAGAVGGGGVDAEANTGSGGGGAGGYVPSAADACCGGGAGEYAELLILNPAATYTYTIGAGGAGGTTSGISLVGGAGGSGVIIVEEYF